MMGGRVKNISLVCLLGFLVSGCANNPLTAPQEGELIEGQFPANWIGQINFAYNEFEKTNQDMSCFIVKMYEREGEFYISFITATKIEVDKDGNVPMYFGYNDPCGQGIKFEFDGSGQFVRKIYSR